MKTLELYDDIISGGNSFITQETAASKPVIYSIHYYVLKGLITENMDLVIFYFLREQLKRKGGGAKSRVTRED